jgi:hypothetical protein
MVQGVSEDPPEPVYEEKKLWMADIRKPKPFSRKYSCAEWDFLLAKG